MNTPNDEIEKLESEISETEKGIREAAERGATGRLVQNLGWEGSPGGEFFRSFDQKLSFTWLGKLREIERLESGERRQALLAEWARQMNECFVTQRRKAISNATCQDCGATFRCYGKAPTLCESCQAAADLLAEQEKRIERFFTLNPGADFYCRRKGNPPRPKQYAEVLAFEPDTTVKEGLGYMIVGESGAGKTAAMYHRAERGAADGEEVLIISPQDLDNIPMLMRSDSDVLAKLIQRWKTVDLLGIDDLDKATLTHRPAAELYKVIETRLRTHRLPLICTMNTNKKKAFLKLFDRVKDEDARHIGKSILTRLQENLKGISFDAGRQLHPTTAIEQ
jgi:DNA replication protein DnaC